jgi:hypothetical protein
MVTLIGNKKATDMAYDLIKEVIDEVQLLSLHFRSSQMRVCLFMFMSLLKILTSIVRERTIFPSYLSCRLTVTCFL